MSTTDILNERKETHGLYDHDAACAMDLIDVMNEHINLRCLRGQSSLTAVQAHSLAMILFKIARIVTGKVDFKDHWDDIAGYATLVAQRCKPEDYSVEEPTGCADDCTHPSHGVHACQNEEPINGADVLGLNKVECYCKAHRCLAEDGTPPKFVYCRKAEEAAARDGGFPIGRSLANHP